MQRLWSAGELGEHWTLLPEDLALLADLSDTGKLGLAAQLAYWRQKSRFPDDGADLAPAVVGHLAAQVGVRADALDGYDWAGRAGRRHRRTILGHLAIVGFDDAAEAAFRRCLAEELLPREPGPAALEEEIAGWFARGRVTRPGAYRLDIARPRQPVPAGAAHLVRPGADDLFLARGAVRHTPRHADQGGRSGHRGGDPDQARAAPSYPYRGSLVLLAGRATRPP